MHRCAIAVVIVVLVAALAGRAWALSSAFTFQGQLQQGGTPTTGQCDVQFGLFSVVSGPGQLGSTQTVSNVSVTNGLFVVQLNGAGEFGPTAFNGADRFLELAVRCPAGSGSFTALTPRQPVTAVPYALFAGAVADNAVGSASIVDGTIGTADLGANAVTSAKITDATVATADLANNAVTSAKIADGTVVPADVSFNFAASTSKGGPASDVACTGCVVNTEVSATGSSNGQVLTSNGTNVLWQNQTGLTLPFTGSVTTAGAGLRVDNSSGAGLQGTSGSVAGVFGVGTPGVRGLGGLGLGVLAESTLDRALFATTSDGIDAIFATTGRADGTGVRAEVSGAQATGVYGESLAGNGVIGETHGNASGVIGVANGSGFGVFGRSDLGNGVTGVSSEGTGVLGHTSNGFDGVLGQSDRADGIGVRGVETGGNGIGVAGQHVFPGATVPYANAFGSGVFGFSLAGHGVYGEASGLIGDGVRGRSTVASGVSGFSNFTGVYGSGDYGVKGEGSNIGVYGANTSSGKAAYLGTSSLAGDFYGDVSVHGEITSDGEITGNNVIRSTGGFPAALIAGATGNDAAAHLRGHTTLAGTEISNDGGGPALLVSSRDGGIGGGIGIRIVSDRESITANGRIITTAGFNGPCNFPNCNSDVAESFQTDIETEPGDVVALTVGDEEPAVQKTTRPYEAALIGVVSTSPGLVLDRGMTRLAGDNTTLITSTKTVVGMVGRVPTKFSLENGPVAVGNPVTSSSTPGVAMRASRAGRIIGYALEPALADGTVLVWLEPGYYVPPAVIARLNELLGDE